MNGVCLRNEQLQDGFVIISEGQSVSSSLSGSFGSNTHPSPLEVSCFNNCATVDGSQFSEFSYVPDFIHSDPFFRFFDLSADTSSFEETIVLSESFSPCLSASPSSSSTSSRMDPFSTFTCTPVDSTASTPFASRLSSPLLHPLPELPEPISDIQRHLNSVPHTSRIAQGTGIVGAAVPSTSFHLPVSKTAPCVFPRPGSLRHQDLLPVTAVEQCAPDMFSFEPQLLDLGDSAGTSNVQTNLFKPDLQHPAFLSVLKSANRKRRSPSTSEEISRNSPPVAKHKEHISKEEIAAHFNLPINKAAQKIGTCVTILKKVCRSFGIERWPHRKLKSLDRWEEQATTVVENNLPGFDIPEIRKALLQLRAKRREILKNPDIQIKQLTLAIRRLLLLPITEQRKSVPGMDGSAAYPLNGCGWNVLNSIPSDDEVDII